MTEFYCRTPSLSIPGAKTIREDEDAHEAQLTGALAGLITGIAASFSMAASEYLSTRTGGKAETAAKSAVNTGTAYIITVALLVMPYLLLENYFLCLLCTPVIAVHIIFFFNCYISVAKEYNFKRRFLEMAGLSVGVAVLSFGIGFLVRATLGIEA